jgi:hypothetical protein
MLYKQEPLCAFPMHHVISNSKLLMYRHYITIFGKHNYSSLTAEILTPVEVTFFNPSQAVNNHSQFG